MIEIVSGPVKLRRHHLADFESIHRWQNDPELLFLNSSTEAVWTQEETERHLRRWIASHEEQQASIYFAICSALEGKLVGFAALALIDTFNDQCRLAVTIADRSYWHMNYGFHSLYGLLTFAFDSLQLHRVMAEVYHFNARALRLMDRLGFQQEGRMRHNVWKNGWQDEFIFGILRSEFDATTRSLASASISLGGPWKIIADSRSSRAER